ncbi:hypothetical protein HZB01_01450 [Candidatus Woesearchaeota archaeon]|nr:hypothetical protein [Candidatus Woesearchaeota archaeon]
MGVLNKLKFWKKDDGFDFEKEIGKDINMKDDDLFASGQKDPFADKSMDIGPSMGTEQGRNNFAGFGEQQPSSPPPTMAPNFPQGFKPSQLPPNSPYMMQQAPPEPQSYGQGFSTSHEQIIMTKNLEIISSKLESLRASMESINQRLANLERVALGEVGGGRRGWM